MVNLRINLAVDEDELSQLGETLEGLLDADGCIDLDPAALRLLIEADCAISSYLGRRNSTPRNGVPVDH